MYQSGKPKRKSKPLCLIQSRGFSFLIGALTGILILLVGMVLLFSEIPLHPPTVIPTSFDSEIPINSVLAATHTPAPLVNSRPTEPPCAWQWATEQQPAIALPIQHQIDELIGGGRAIVSVTAYGENCVTYQEGVAGYFAPMQTDFEIFLPYISPETDEADFIERLDAVMSVLVQYPVDQTPGPLSGRITFIMGETMQQRQFMNYQDAVDVYNSGLRGMALWQAMFPAETGE